MRIWIKIVFSFLLLIIQSKSFRLPENIIPHFVARRLPRRYCVSARNDSLGFRLSEMSFN
ncbi:MAG: hypothetical protein IKZ88_00110 [Neisseriaceae bacterium]|nr:hypothetical protein [Neisseriaceae bacterium]